MSASFAMRAPYLLLLFQLFMLRLDAEPDYGQDHAGKLGTKHYDDESYVPPKPPIFDDDRGAQVTTLPPNPVYSIPGGMTAESFPADRPPATKSSLPPPESSAGRWLHTACYIADLHKVIIYGGVSSYTSLHLLNDIWVKKHDGWSELQGSFVPRLPYALLDPKPASPFRPDDVPSPPPMENVPGSEVTAPLNPSSYPGNPARFAMKKKTKVGLVQLAPIPFSPMNSPGFNSFVEEQATVTRASARPLRHRRSITVPTRLETIMLQLSETEQGVAPPAKPEGYFAAGKAYAVSGESMPTKDPKKDGSNPNKVPFAPDDLWSYDIYSLTWTYHKAESNTAERPVVRWMHSAVPILSGTKTEKVFIFGGASFAGVVLSDGWNLSPSTMKWQKINWAKPVIPRQGHTCVQADATTIYCYGGVSYGYEPFFDVLQYKFATPEMKSLDDDTPFTQRPPGRWLHAAAWYGGMMFIFGGITHDYVPLNDLIIWNPAGKKETRWTRLTTNYPPPPRGLASSTIVGSKLVIFGGMTNNLPLQDMWSIDLAVKEASGNVKKKPTLDDFKKSELKWKEDIPFGAFPFAREGGTLVTISNAQEPQETADDSVPPTLSLETIYRTVSKLVQPASPGAADDLLQKGGNGERGFEMRPVPQNVKRPSTLGSRQRKNVGEDEIMLLFGGASNVNNELSAP